jgi:hypothetical protein
MQVASARYNAQARQQQPDALTCRCACNSMHPDNHTALDVPCAECRPNCIALTASLQPTTTPNQYLHLQSKRAAVLQTPPPHIAPNTSHSTKCRKVLGVCLTTEGMHVSTIALAAAVGEH